MRRRVGVGHVLQERQQQQRMADLGAQITAERVGQIEDQLEELQAQLKILAQRHKSDIKEDPVVRARFRQLAESLGVDLISSKRSVFSSVFGLGDFYYQLAGRTVEACMKERKFCGAYVPLQRVQFFVQKAYDASSLVASNTHSHKRLVISEADVLMALSKLLVLGAGYNVVKLGGISYIQTTPDGTRGGDHVILLNCLLELQREQMEKAMREIAEKQQKGVTMPAVPSSGSTAVGERNARSGIGAAYALGVHPFDLGDGKNSSESVSVPFAQQCVAVRDAQIADRLNWKLHRARAALKQMVQEGTVWVEEPPCTSQTHVTESSAPSKHTEKSKAVFSSAEKPTTEYAAA